MTDPKIALQTIDYLRERGAYLIKVGDIEAHFPPAPPVDTAEILAAIDGRKKSQHEPDPEQPGPPKRSRPDVLSDPGLGLPSLPHYDPINPDDDE